MKISIKKREIERLKTRIQRYEHKISETREKHKLKELSDKRRDYFLKFYQEKIQDCKWKIQDGEYNIRRTIGCVKRGIINRDPENIIFFQQGPLTNFIQRNVWFWQTIFPNAKEYLKFLNKIYCKNSILIKCANKKDAGLLGTATDFLLGFMIGDPLVKQSLRSSSFGKLGILTEYILSIFFRLKSEINHKSPLVHGHIII